MMSEYYKGIPDCWDIMCCPREVRASCPAYPDHGSECWKVTGTMCAQGKFNKKNLSEKILYCRNECEFYKEFIRDKFP